MHGLHYARNRKPMSKFLVYFKQKFRMPGELLYQRAKTACWLK